MNICVIGTGYVGLVTGTCFAEVGNDVTCIDIDTEKISRLKEGIMPIFEPGLEEMVKRNFAEERLSFSTDTCQGVKAALFVFIAVGTPPDEDGSADLKHVLAVARSIGQSIEKYTIVINKSTVPVGTADKVRAAVQAELDKRQCTVEFDVTSNPEFLKEGAAIEDFMTPDRVVIGSDNVRTMALMKELYSTFVSNGRPLVEMDIRSAEMTKYAANAMLATKISFMNEIAGICEQVGADVTQVRMGIGSDSRIGYRYLYPGVGYGGSCFPKDVQALARTAQEYGCPGVLVTAVEKVNNAQKKVLMAKIVERLGADLSGYTFAVWGLAFKPQTDDMREAPAIVTISALLDAGAKVVAYDPEATAEAKRAFGDRPGLTYAKTNYLALAGADALIVITEWKQFRRPNFELMLKELRLPLIFDGRNIFDPARMAGLGFEYISIGRPTAKPKAS